MQQKYVYLDHAATTPLDPEVLSAMQPFLSKTYGNPSSFHTVGKEAKDALEIAHQTVANAINCRPDEVIFTSGGTEGDNLAILGIARKHQKHGKHIISAKTEHQAVLEPLAHLERNEGFEITYVPVDKEGLINPEDVIAAIRPDTTLVTLMMANNEIGTITPIREIATKIKKQKQESKSAYPYVHTDACQALGSLEIDTTALGVDLLTINSGKIYGPKGAGALYIKRGLKLQPLQFGGSQMRRHRPGTENLPAIIGFAKAVEIATKNQKQYAETLIPLRDELITRILKEIPKTRLNGHPTSRLPNNVNISFLDIEGEALLLYLDASGVYAATGSACTSETLDPSHVILALGLPYEVAHGSIRFSLGRSTTQEDIDHVISVLPPLVEKLRKISPVRVDKKYYE